MISEEELKAIENEAMPKRHKVLALAAEVRRLRDGIIEHASQKADDLCIEDDEKLHALVGMKRDTRVGDKEAMLRNCARFIEKRCTGGGWPTYAQLEFVLKATRLDVGRIIDALLNDDEMHKDDCPLDDTCDCELPKLINTMYERLQEFR